MRIHLLENLVVIFFCLGLTSPGRAQDNSAAQAPDPQQTAQSASPPSPAPLPTPAITGPLKAAPPNTFDAGPFGKLCMNGIISGMGLWQGSPDPGNKPTHGDLSNGQLFIQKTTGWWQFYVQAGAYNIPILGSPSTQTGETMSKLFGPVPVVFLKLVPGKNTSIQVGTLPTLMGAEYTFTFQNMNIDRGLLWNQENDVNRGIQVNQTLGKFTASMSWNDGFYSNRYSWLSGSLTYADGPHSLAFTAMGNLGQTAFRTQATPVQNNSTMYAVIYTYTKGSWIVQPYYQYTTVPANQKIGIIKGNTTQGGAVLLNYAFKHGFSLPVRWEYITSTGNADDPEVVNLLYGPGSKGTSITLTPTYQYKDFFVRGDLSWVHASDISPGSAFGQGGNLKNQARAMTEFGFIF